jgi:molecular chaperone IbpA
MNYSNNFLPNPYEQNPHDKYPYPKKSEWQKPIPTKPVTIADLFPRLDRWGIGILNELEHFKTIADSKPSYPPYNITYDKAIGGVWEIALAVAGFRKHELEVEVDDRTLIVRTDPKVNFESEDVRQVIHQGIAQRNFELKFALAEYVEVTKVELKDGLLTISLEKQIPEEKKPKVIDIE